MIQAGHVISSPAFEDRRSKQRFPITAPVAYRLHSRGTRVPKAGSGQTVNLSSDGVLIRTEGPSLPVGVMAQLRIAWPLNLNDRIGLTLVVVGPVVRSQGDYAAIRVKRSEFRTRLHDELSNMVGSITAGLPMALGKRLNTL